MLRSFTALATGVVIAACASTADAAESGNTAIIEEVVVTATHRETNLMDTPMAISAANADTIEQLGATDLAGLFRTIPGLNVSSTESGSNRIVVRGISSQAGTLSYAQTSSTVAVYLDDTPMTSANGPARQLGGSLFDINRVEVLKGPQGTLFGEGSQGGTIRYIYNQPDTSALDYKIKAGYNFQGESDDYSHRIDGMLNIPVSDTFALRVMAFAEDKAGWIDKTNLIPVEKDVNGSESTGGRLAAKWNASERLSLLGSVFYVDTQTDGSMFASRPFREFDNVRNPAAPPESTDEFTLYNLHIDFDLDWATFTSSTSYFERETHAVTESLPSVALLFDQFVGLNVNLGSLNAGGGIVIPCNPDVNGIQDAFFSQTSVCPWGDGTSLLSFGNDSTSDSKRLVQEFRLVSSGDGPWLWTIGAFYKTSEDFRSDFQPFGMGAGREALAPLFQPLFNDPSNSHEDTLDEISGFGEVTWAPNDQWEFTVGARISNLEQDFENTSTGTDDTPISPKATIAWRPAEDALVFFNFANGFRPGNVNNGQEFNLRQFTAAGLPQQVLDLVAGYVTYEGDEVNNFELGTKLTLADGSVQLTASVYYLDWKDTILFFKDTNIPGANNNYNFNAGAAHSQGVELEVSWVPVARLNLRLAADINEAELDETVPDTLFLKGNSMAFAPESSVSASVDYTVDIGSSFKGRIRVDHQRVGEQFTAADNVYKLDPYHTSNVRFTLTDSANEQWTASLFANNVTDEVNVLSSFDTFGTFSYLYSQPRTIGLEFTWQARR